MAYDHDITAIEFYHATLTASGISPAPEQVEKTAAALQLPVEVVKIAKAFSEQLVLDNVPYKTAQDRANDAIRMAQAYVEFKTALYKQSAQDVDGVMAQLLEAAKTAVASAPSLADMPLHEVLKIAALQAESKAAYEAVPEALKVAALSVPSLYHGGSVEFKNLTGQTYSGLAKHLGASSLNPSEHRAFVLKQHGFDPADAEADKHMHNVLQTTHDLGPDATLAQGLEKYRASTEAAQPGWMRRNAAWLVPAGLLGAGAAYALHKRRDDAKKKTDAI